MFVPEATWEEYEERQRREREQAAPVDTAWQRATELMMQPSRSMPLPPPQPVAGGGNWGDLNETLRQRVPGFAGAADVTGRALEWEQQNIARPGLEVLARGGERMGAAARGEDWRAMPSAFDTPENKGLAQSWEERPESFPGQKGAMEILAPTPSALLPLGEIARGVKAGAKAIGPAARAVNEMVTSPALRRVAPGLGVEEVAEKVGGAKYTGARIGNQAKEVPVDLPKPLEYRMGVDPEDRQVLRIHTPVMADKRTLYKGPRVTANYDLAGNRLFAEEGSDPQLLAQADASAKRIAGQWQGRWQEITEPIFVRYGKVPKSGRSRNYATGEEERGVSAILAHRDPSDGHIELDGDLYSSGFALAVRGEPAYLLTGKVIGYGSDGEPLLANVKVRGQLDRDFMDDVAYSLAKEKPPPDGIRNAITSPPEIGGAIVGGIAYQDDPNLSPEENLARRAAFAAGGYGLGYGARKLGGKSRLGGTIEDASKPPLGQMYAERPGSFNVGETVRSIGNTWERGRRAVVRAFTDADVDVAKFQQQAAKTAGRPLNADEMLYELKRLNVDKAAEVNLQENLRPILREIGDDRNWLSEYLTYQDNIDVAKAMNNPSRKFSGNLTADDSAARLIQMKDALGPERMQKVEQTATQVQAFNRQLLQRKVDSGVITQELADDLTQKYPHYSPTRITDYLQEPTNISRGKSLSVRDSGLRRNTVEGTTREREDPLASIVRNAYQTEALARKNQAFQAFVKLRDMSDEAVKSSIRPVADTYTPIRGEAKVTGFVDGVRQTYVVPKALEQVIKNEPKAVIPGFAGTIWGGMMNLFRMGATSRNPVFLASNAFLDAGTYAIRETTRAGGPQHLPKVLLELGKAYGNAFQGIFSGTYRGQTAEFLKGGGGMFGYFQGSPKAAKKGVQELARGNVFSVNSASDLGRLAKDLVTLRPVEGIGERIELAPRVASFSLAQGRGSNQVRAVVNGRTVTMDFAQGGNVSKVFNQFVPFFNVGMQSPAQAWRAFKENPKAFLATTATLLAGPTVAAEAWNRSDPQRAKDYDDVPQYLKDQGIVIMLPVEAAVDAQGNRKPQFVHLRMREYAPFVVLTREAIQKAMGDNPRDWWDLTQGALGSVSPIQGNTPADTLAAFTPLGVSTGLQLASNQDYFRNRMIATKSGDERASEISKQIAGATGTRPSQVEFAVRDLASGVGGAGLAAGDLIAGKSKGNTPQDAPVVGGAYGRFVRGNTGQRLDEARRNLLQPETQKQLKKAGAELNLGIVGYSIDGIPLRQAEQERYQVLANEYTNIYVRKAFNLPNWERYSPEQRTEIVKDLASKAREAAGNVVLSEMGKEERKRRLLQEAG